MTEALVLNGKHDVKLVRRRKEELKSGFVRVKIKRVSLCGSDYKLYEGNYGGPDTYPIIFGHEWSGIVTELGENVRTLSVGDHVTGDCSLFCGHCKNCLIDKNLCINIRKAGITEDGFARSEAVVDSRFLYKADKSISFKALALAEPFAVAYHALMRVLGAELFESYGMNVLIIGCGTIGIAAYLLMRLRWGINSIDVYDNDFAHIYFLAELTGKEVTVYDPVFSDTAGDNNYKSLYGDRKYNLVFEMAGSAQALDEAMKAVKPGGKIVTVGTYGHAETQVGLITLKKISLYGSIGGTGEFVRVIDFFKKYGAIVEKLVTDEYHYTRAADAFEGTDDKEETVIKRQLVFE